jgi:hypothetical protein
VKQCGMLDGLDNYADVANALADCLGSVQGDSRK